MFGMDHPADFETEWGKFIQGEILLTGDEMNVLELSPLNCRNLAREADTLGLVDPSSGMSRRGDV